MDPIRGRGEVAIGSVMTKSMISQRPYNRKTRMRRHTILRIKAPCDLNYKKLLLILSIGAVGNWATLLSSAVETATDPPSGQSKAAASNDITLTARNESSVANASLASLNTLTSVPIKLETASPIDEHKLYMTRISTGAPPSNQRSEKSSDNSEASGKSDEEGKVANSIKINSYTVYEPSASYSTVSHVTGPNDDLSRVHSPSVSGETSADAGGSRLGTIGGDHNHSYRVSDALLHREHHHHYNQHQPYSSQRYMRDDSGSSNDTSRTRDSYGNHSINSRIRADTSNTYQQHIPNHNYGPTAESSNHLHTATNLDRNNSFFNAELIQSLTASLFPKRNLSNATLHSLSELLNKTRQLQQQQQQQQQLSNYEPPVYYQPSSRQSQYAAFNSNNTYGRQSSGNRNLDALINEHTYGLLGFLNPENNRFGFRDTSYSNQHSLIAPSSSTTKQHYPLYEGPKPKYGSSKSDSLYSKTPSNIYNTYLPYAGGATATTNAAASSLSQSAPMVMTNGQQALNFALYHSLLNDDIPKWSSNKNNEVHTKQGNSSNNALRSMLNSITDGAFAPTGSQTINGYQYIQQQNTNNQNHLDRLTYHSTPFRPTIASPSSSFQATTATNSQQVASYNRSKYLDPTRPTTVSYPSALGSLQSSSTSEQQSASAAAGTGRFRDISGQPQAGQQQNNYVAGSRVVASGPNETADQSTTSSDNLRLKNQPTTSSQATTNSNYSQPQQQQPTTIHSGAPAILFELYEREIDNQIREAIYADHQQHHSHLGPALHSIASSNNQWLTAAEAASNQVVPSGLLSEDTTSSSNIAVPTTDKPTFGQSILPRPLSTAYSYASAQSTFPYFPRQPPPPAFSLPMQQSASSTVSQSDSTLATALQELPTFTAADLQPLIPIGRPAAGIPGLPEYSMLSVSHQKPEPSYSESSPSLLASADNWLGLNQNDFYAANRPFPFSDNPLLAPDLHLKPSTDAPVASTSSGQGSITSGLSSMLLKLQPGPLTSILASPFAHLYASLPRYRYGKKQQANQSSSQPAASSSSASFLNPLIGHSSIRGLWQMLGNGTAGNEAVVRDSVTPYSVDQNGGLHTRPVNRYQSKRLAAITAANLLASSNGGQPIDPIHLLALMQAAQANLMAPQSPGVAVSSDLAGLASSDSASQINPYSATTSLLDNTINSLDHSVSHNDPPESQWIANGMTPQTWQSIQSAMQWNKKWQQHQPQTHAAASYSNLYESLAKPTMSIRQPPGNGAAFSGGLNSSGPSSTLFGRQMTTPLSLLLGGASSPLSHLLGSQLTQPSSRGNTGPITPAPTETTSSKVLPPRLKIKILKVPVAVYDNTVGQPVGADNFNLLPTNLHSALASLHADLPCASLHQQQAAASAAAAAGKPLVAASANAAGVLHPAININPLQQYLSSPLAPTSPIKLANRDNDELLASLASHMNLESPKPATAQIQGFTDINQPTDLQVAPTYLQHQNKSNHVKLGLGHEA